MPLLPSVGLVADAGAGTRSGEGVHLVEQVRGRLSLLFGSKEENSFSLFLSLLSAEQIMFCTFY